MSRAGRPRRVGPGARAELDEALGYRIGDEVLLAQAFSHRSWCSENDDAVSNERLEFLGDAVLGFVVADHVYSAGPDFDEGTLTDIRKAVVNSVCLAEVALELGLGDHIRLGKGEEASGGREKPSILADATEAVLGAVYLDGGIAAARIVILRLLGSRIDAAVRDGGGNQDHKSRLQERVATLTESPVRYRFEATGPDHARQFTATAVLEGSDLGSGIGRSKKQAEQEAAKAALVRLDEMGPDIVRSPEALTGTIQEGNHG